MVYVANADDRRALPEGPTSMKMLSQSRRLLAVFALALPAALLAPGAALATPPADPQITVSPDQPKTNQEITFGVATPVSGVTYLWDTNNDGVFGQPDDIATRTFNQSGDYIVAVKAVDDTTQEESAVVSRKVSVTDPPPCPSTPGPGNGPPDAKFSVNNTQPVVGQAIRVRSRSTDPEGCALTNAWIADGGDALIEDAGAAITNVTFAQAGDWTLTLQVTDDAQNTRSIDRVIHVREVPPAPNQLPNIPTFTVTPTSPTVNQLLTFKATASDPDGTIERIDWDFENDGEFDASGETVQRTFTSRWQHDGAGPGHRQPRWPAIVVPVHLHRRPADDRAAAVDGRAVDRPDADADADSHDDDDVHAGSGSSTRSSACAAPSSAARPASRCCRSTACPAAPRSEHAAGAAAARRAW